MSSMITDPIRSRIYNELRVHYDDLEKDFLVMTAKNLAFLVRHHSGPEINPNMVSVPIIDMYEDEEAIGHKAALVIHASPSKNSIIIQHKSALGHKNCLIHGLSELAERSVAKSLEEQREELTHHTLTDLRGHARPGTIGRVVW